MRTIIITIILASISMTALAQAPNRPLIPLNTYSLQGYHAINSTEAFNLPEGIEFSSVAGVAFNSAGHLIVLHRGTRPFLEFDADGEFIRAFGEDGMLVRSHGLHIDKDDNLWVTDVSGHVVLKLDGNANVLMTLGTPGEAGDWDEAAGKHLFNQPNEVALDSAGNIYVVQGHGASAEPKVLKFDPQGRFIRQWGQRGEGPGDFVVAHSIQIDSDDTIYVADRENFRVEIFDTDGNYLREWKFNAMACSIYLHDDGYMYMTTGFDGEFAKLDMMGNVLGSLGSPGTENGQFGEAHYLTVDAEGNVFIADVVNRRVQKYVKD